MDTKMNLGMTFKETPAEIKAGRLELLQEICESLLEVAKIHKLHPSPETEVLIKKLIEVKENYKKMYNL